MLATGFVYTHARRFSSTFSFQSELNQQWEMVGTPQGLTRQSILQLELPFGQLFFCSLCKIPADGRSAPWSIYNYACVVEGNPDLIRRF